MKTLAPTAPPRLPHAPRPTVRFLLVWTALTAMLLVVVTRGMRTGLTGPLSGAILVVASMGVGWLLSATLLIFRHAITETLWPLEPGEWLILTASNAITLCLVLFLAGQHPEWLDLRPDRPLFHTIYLLSPAQCSALFAVAALAQRKRRPWWQFFAALALSCLSLYGLMIRDLPDEPEMAIIVAAPFFLLLGSAVALIRALLTDWSNHEPRHWLHKSVLALVVLGMGCWALLGWNS